MTRGGSRGGSSNSRSGSRSSTSRRSPQSDGSPSVVESAGGLASAPTKAESAPSSNGTSAAQSPSSSNSMAAAPSAAAAAGNADGGDATEESSRDTTYFSYYSALSNQQNMLQDAVRTGTYQWAILQNKTDFAGKVVLDVGAGSGILSFFAVQAGARKVYAVEASDVAVFARQLVEANGLSDKIVVLKGKLEDLTVPEKVDVIVSEPMGVLLVHERMIETFIRGRISWLKEGGKMFPGTSTIYVAPFTDAYLYTETMSKVRFWQQEEFYGVNLSALVNDAFAHHFGQPVVGCFDPRTLMSTAVEYPIDFNTVSLEQLQTFTIPFRCVATYTGIVHGLAGWFDVHFNGSDNNVTLSTSPYGQKTHWYQIRFLLKNPIAINAQQVLAGSLHLTVNDQRSYRVTLTAGIEGTAVRQEQVYQLHEQQYWYPTVPDPGTTVLPETNNLYGRAL